MKKLLSSLLALVLVLSMCSTAYADAVKTENVVINLTEEELQDSPSSVIQAALDLRNDLGIGTITVNLPSGKYVLEAPLYIFSDTTLNLQADTILFRGFDGASLLKTGLSADANYGYSGYKNIVISGGVWDSNFAVSTAIRFIHCQNVTLKNCTVRNVCDSHHIEIGAANNLVLNGVTLTGYKRTKNTSGEAVQIDPVHSSEHFKSSQYLDDTPCKNITVKNCTFKDVFSGVGTRAGVNGSYFDNIRIINNTFTNIKDKAICTFNYVKSTIKNNTITNATVGIFFEEYPTKNLTSKLYVPYSSTANPQIVTDINTTISNNTIVVKKTTGYAQSCGIGVYGGVLGADTAKKTGLKKGSYLVRNIRISNNQITLKTTSSCGMELKYVYDSKISSNTVTEKVTASSMNGISLYHSQNDLLSKNTVSGKTAHGISLSSNSIKNELASNSIKKVQKYGIYISGNSYAQINASNTYSKNGKGNIYIKDKKINVPTFEKKLKITRKGKKTKVKWEKNKDASGYYVYRATKKGGTYKLIKTITKKSKTTFSEKSKKKYYYKVSAYKKYNKSLVLGAKKG